MGSLEFLSNINQETYKYVARVMYENKFYDAAFNYMEKSKKLFYQDPELHFMFAKYYTDNKLYDKALQHINECLNIVPGYFPALELKKIISLYLV